MLMKVVLTVLLLAASMAAETGEEKKLSYSRGDFPAGFVFGSGTSAYQVEGAAAEDGRTPSIWDTFTHAGYVKETGDIASDQYHIYKEDVKLMAETGLDAYRFSISWSRLIPDGRGNINHKGLQYYNNLINELVAHGIQPHATLCHFDLPQVLEDEYEGWLSHKIIDDFTTYANVCFREFGDRVSHWTTINEANVFAAGGYDGGILPPRRCSYPFGNCTYGNSTTEPYIVAHHSLLAHSSAALLYRKKYQAQQKGYIGLNILGICFQPLTNSISDLNAAKRMHDFFIGWYVEPLVRGDYPDTMRKLTGKKMPEFSRNQSEQLKGSFDFIGLNYYIAIQVADDPSSLPAGQRDYTGDALAKPNGNLYPGPGGKESGTKTLMDTYGFQVLLERFKQAYGNPPIYIHENGFPMRHNDTLNDTARVEHMSAHLGSLLDSIRNGSNVRGYLSWSFVDVFELFGGYQTSYGLYHVDFESKEKKRYPKFSAHWYADFLKRNASIIRTTNGSSHESPLSISAM